MTLFTAPNGVEYETKLESNSGSLLMFTPKEGGATPKELSGTYTSPKFMEEAWGRYIESLKKAPDKRLKQNRTPAKAE